MGNDEEKDKQISLSLKYGGFWSNNVIKSYASAEWLASKTILFCSYFFSCCECDKGGLPRTQRINNNTNVFRFRSRREYAREWHLWAISLDLKSQCFEGKLTFFLMSVKVCIHFYKRNQLPSNHEKWLRNDVREICVYEARLRKKGGNVSPFSVRSGESCSLSTRSVWTVLGRDRVYFMTQIIAPEFSVLAT